MLTKFFLHLGSQHFLNLLLVFIKGKNCSFYLWSLLQKVLLFKVEAEMN